MRIAIISDIHGNMDAFNAVLDDIDNLGISTIFSLGDNIGYGPEPEQVVSRLIKRRIPSVIGNHELAVVDPKNLTWFNPTASESLVLTLAMLADASITHIRAMKTFMTAHGCRFVHGFPPSSVKIYSFQVTGLSLLNLITKMEPRMCFIGHTHELECIEYDGSAVRRSALTRGIHPLKPKYRYIINVGSVGQPRDGDKSAKYVILDFSAQTIESRFVPYDTHAVVEKILKAGLPESLAMRLL
jgi:predicted phosphodiesterase